MLHRFSHCFANFFQAATKCSLSTPLRAFSNDLKLLGWVDGVWFSELNAVVFSFWEQLLVDYWTFWRSALTVDMKNCWEAYILTILIDIWLAWTEKKIIWFSSAESKVGNCKRDEHFQKMIVSNFNSLVKKPSYCYLFSFSDCKTSNSNFWNSWFWTLKSNFFYKVLIIMFLMENLAPSWGSNTLYEFYITFFKKSLSLKFNVILWRLLWNFLLQYRIFQSAPKVRMIWELVAFDLMLRQHIWTEAENCQALLLWTTEVNEISLVNPCNVCNCMPRIANFWTCSLSETVTYHANVLTVHS